MQKIIYITLVAFFISACSVSKKAIIEEGLNLKEITTDILEKNNITGADFNISRAEVEISENGNRSLVIASMKYMAEGRYLVSIRSRAGIELARIYISNDTVLANDRINRKLYTGSTEYLQKKYGISFNLIPLLFGDIVKGEENENYSAVKCRMSYAEISENFGKNNILYKVDCQNGKVINTIIKNESGAGEINIEFNNFNKNNGFIYPSELLVSDAGRKSGIGIQIKKIEFQKTETLKFIPGANYEQIILK